MISSLQSLTAWQTIESTCAKFNHGASRIERDLGLRLASEEATRKLFPASGDAREVRDRLVDACRRRGVRIRYGASVESLRAVPASERHSDDYKAAPRDGSHTAQHQPSHLRSTAAECTAVHANGGGPAATDAADHDETPRWVCGLRDGSEVGMLDHTPACRTCQKAMARAPSRLWKVS